MDKSAKFSQTVGMMPSHMRPALELVSAAILVMVPDDKLSHAFETLVHAFETLAHAFETLAERFVCKG